MANTIYESDEVLDEIYDEMYRREEDRPKSSLAALDTKTKFFIGLFVAAVVLLILLERISLTNGLIALGLGFIVLWFMKGVDPVRAELSYIECMIRVNDLLSFLQKHPIGQQAQVPKGRIHITPVGRKEWREGKGFKRSFGVNIYDEKKKVTDTYFVEVDIYTGDIITFKKAPEGVYGDETKDVKIIPTQSMVMEKRKEEFLGKAYKRY